MFEGGEEGGEIGAAGGMRGFGGGGFGDVVLDWRGRVLVGVFGGGVGGGVGGGGGGGWGGGWGGGGGGGERMMYFRRMPCWLGDSRLDLRRYKEERQRFG